MLQREVGAGWGGGGKVIPFLFMIFWGGDAFPVYNINTGFVVALRDIRKSSATRWIPSAGEGGDSFPVHDFFL